MGCSASKREEDVRFTSPQDIAQDAEKHAQALVALAALDEPLVGVLSSGDIRLLCAAWMREQPEGWQLQRRQDLEALEKAGERPFLSTEQAEAGLRKGERVLAIISQCAAPPPSPLPPALQQPRAAPVRARSGWLKPGSPDPHGARLALVLAFLADHPEIEGVFFDFASLPQKPRSAAEDAMMGRGLEVMGSLCARAPAASSPILPP